jgi:hypothetical protein
MKYIITNETLKSKAQDIQKEFETGGASWEGLALEIARLELTLEAIKKDGLEAEIKIDLGSWDGAYCASEEDITLFDPKCCEHDYESACACCIGECDNCYEEENTKTI